MPDVVGQQLDLALGEIEQAGINQDVDVSGGGTFGVVDESNWTVCEQSPAAGDVVQGAPVLTVDRSCSGGTTEPEPSTVPDTPETVATEPETTEPETTEPEMTKPEAIEPEATDPIATSPEPPPVVTGPEEGGPNVSPPATPATESPYIYEGPAYEVVTFDRLPIGLDQYFVLIDDLDHSTDAYKDQIKLIIADVARSHDTASLAVNVVTDREVALVESFSTAQDFYAERGDAYVNEVVLPKQATEWLAAYVGGYDYGTAELSDSASAFEVTWFPYGSAEIEQWKP